MSLNKRHFGAIQWLNKQETVNKYGKDQVLLWRGSHDIPPPALDEASIYYPGNDKRYTNIPKDKLPITESLKLTEECSMVDWHNVLAPEIKSGKNILIAAHGSALRVLVNVSSDKITDLNIPTCVSPLSTNLN